MAVKVYDTISPASDSFPALMAEHVNLVREDGTTDSIQNLYNNKELGAGGDTSIITTESEYLALPEEEKLNNSYYLYDIGVHYKNGVAYSRKKPIQLTMEEYKALGEVDPDQEYIISADEQGILLSAEDIGYNNAESGIQATTVQGAIDKVNGNLGEKVDYKVVVEDGTRYVEDVVTQDINTWLPNDNSSILINLKKTNGINYLNFQLLCNKKDSKNWSCIVNGAANELWKIRYINGVRYIDELATMDKVVKDSGTTVETLYNNSTGAFLETDMNLTATRSGILKVSFNKKETGNTLNIYINGIHKYAYPNWWGENIYETAYIPVNNGDKIRISTDVSGEGHWYRIVNVLII